MLVCYLPLEPKPSIKVTLFNSDTGMQLDVGALETE